MRKITKHFKSTSYIKRGGVIIAFLLCLGSCKKNQDIAPKPNAENPAIVKKFLAHTSELPKNVQAIIKDLQTKQEAQPFITDFAQKNGFPDWQKTISVVSKSNMATKQAKTTVQPTTSKSDLFFVPLFGADSTQLLSYLVVYQYDERTFAYKNYNKNNLLADPKIKDEAFKPQIMGCFSPFTLWDSRFAEKLPAGIPVPPFVIEQKKEDKKRRDECGNSINITTDIYINAEGEPIIRVTVTICFLGIKDITTFDIGRINTSVPQTPTGSGGGGTNENGDSPTSGGGGSVYITQGGGQSPWWELPQGGPNGETPRPQIEQEEEPTPEELQLIAFLSEVVKIDNIKYRPSKRHLIKIARKLQDLTKKDIAYQRMYEGLKNLPKDKKPFILAIPTVKLGGVYNKEQNFFAFGEAPPEHIVAEEFVHAYQYLIKYPSEIKPSIVNIECEAKLILTIIAKRSRLGGDYKPVFLDTNPSAPNTPESDAGVQLKDWIKEFIDNKDPLDTFSNSLPSDKHFTKAQYDKILNLWKQYAPDEYQSLFNGQAIDFTIPPKALFELLKP